MIAGSMADVGQVVAIRQEGAGQLLSSSRAYPLGALTYVGSSGGRGALSLKLAGGRVQLAGGDADQTSPTTWRLKIETIRLVSQRRVRGSCDLRLTPDGLSYAGLTCRGSISPNEEPFAVSWAGDGTPKRHLSIVERP